VASERKELATMNKEQLAAFMADHNPEALLADGFEDAFLGPAQRCGQPTLAAYSYKKCVGILMSRDEMSEEEAIEWMDFNVVGAWAGPGTPVWVIDHDE
jgi:hypothetical protein